MDIASLVGLVGAKGEILAEMNAGGGVATFIDSKSIFSFNLTLEIDILWLSVAAEVRKNLSSICVWWKKIPLK